MLAAMKNFLKSRIHKKGGKKEMKKKNLAGGEVVVLKILQMERKGGQPVITALIEHAKLSRKRSSRIEEKVILGRRLKVVTGINVLGKFVKYIDESGNVIFESQNNGNGRVGVQYLGRERVYADWNQNSINFLKLLNMLTAQEIEDGISEERFMVLIPVEIGKTYLKRYRYFFRKYFGQKSAKKEECWQAN
jgi:hypothetical protein